MKRTLLYTFLTAVVVVSLSAQTKKDTVTASESKQVEISPELKFELERDSLEIVKNTSRRQFEKSFYNTAAKIDSVTSEKSK